MADTIYYDVREERKLTAAAAVACGEIWQLKDGRAAVYQGALPAASGDPTGWKTDGVFKIPKTASIVILDGGRVYWDASASKAHFKKVDDRDFYLGRASGDAASSDTYVYVNINIDPPYDVDLLRDASHSIPVGTAAAGGFGYPRVLGGAHGFYLTATSEAQKIDLISTNGFATGANAIVEFAFRMPNGGSGSASDFSLGIANATHATDADSITDSVFIHMDGGATDIKAESDDGTTEVSATDTTVDFTAGITAAVRKEVWFDMRNPADIQIYIDGVLVLPDSVFNVNASTATWRLLAHLEKTSGTETADMIVDWMRARLSEQ